jgi:hypothetical protein
LIIAHEQIALERVAKTWQQQSSSKRKLVLNPRTAFPS